MCAVMRESSGPRNAPTSSPKFYTVHCSAMFPLLLWSVLVSSCSGYVDWIYPSDEDNGLVFNYIDTVYFTWTSNIGDPYMNLWCAPSPTDAQSPTYGKTRLALRDLPHPFAIPRRKTPQKENQALKCGEKYSIPQRSLNQWHKPSVIPIQGLL